MSKERGQWRSSRWVSLRCDWTNVRWDLGWTRIHRQAFQFAVHHIEMARIAHNLTALEILK